MKRKTRTFIVRTRLRAKKAWLRFRATGFAQHSEKVWRGFPKWLQMGIGGTALVLALGGLFLVVKPAQADQKSVAISAMDVMDGISSYGTIKLTSSTGSIQLQDGAAGTWNQGTTNGMQVNPNLVYGVTRIIYGPNDTLYQFSTMNGNCYLNKYVLETQNWGRVTSPPVYCGAGTVASYDGNGSIYYAPGGPTATPSNRFFRYDISTDTWTELATFPSTVGNIADGTMVVQGNKRYFYLFRGQSSPSFWRYDVSANSWSTLNSFPTSGNVSNGISLAWDGGSMLYAMANTSGEFKRFDIVSGTWTNLATVPDQSDIRQTMTFVNGTLYSLGLKYSGNYYALRSYNPQTAVWTVLSANSSTGSEFDNPPPTATDGGRYIYSIMGTEVWLQMRRYDTVNQTWNSATLLDGDSSSTEFHQMPVYDNAQSFYYVGGTDEGSTDRIYKYDMSSNIATRIGSQTTTKSGGMGVYIGGQVYFLPYYSTTQDFQKYDIASNNFISLSSLPFGISSGATIIDGGDGYIYVNFGGRTNFQRYNITTNTWSALTSMPQTPGAGGAATRIGRNIYYLVGGGSAYFYIYNMDSGTWTSNLTLPRGGVDHGGFMTSDGSRYIYAGLSDRTVDGARSLWRYDITNSSWTRMADVPQSTFPYASAYYDTTNNKLYVSAGRQSSLLWQWSPGTTTYQSSGSWYSKSYDLKQVSTWTSLTSTVTGSGTTSIYTRTSSDNTIWTDWAQTSGTQIQSPTNRYIQVKVTLSGTGSSTPTVTNMSIQYDQETTAPSLPSQLIAYEKKGSTNQLTSGQTSQSQHPYFTWSGATDGASGSGVAGYYVYFGSNSNADPQIDGSYQTNSDYIVTSAMTAGDLTYLRIKTVDALGNVSAAATFYTYRYFYISPPGSQVKTSDSDFSDGTNTGVSIADGSMKLTSAGNGSWSSGPATAPPDTTLGGTMAVVGDYVYTARGSSSSAFWRYNTTNLTWSTLASVPGTVTYGSSMTYDGNGNLYLVGGGDVGFYRYNIENDTWTVINNLPSVAQIGTDIRYIGNNQIAVLMTGVREFYSYNTVSGTFTPLSTYPTTISSGGSGIWYDGNDTIYAYMGSWVWYNAGTSRPAMTSYTISTDTWKVLATSPISSAYTQNNLLYDGKGGLYVFVSSMIDTLTASQRAYRYDIAKDSWSPVTNMPAQVYYGSATSDNSRYFYILPGTNGANMRKMVRYDTLTQKFSPETSSVDVEPLIAFSTPTNARLWTQGNATSAVYDGSKYIYALMASEQTSSYNLFARYDYKTGDTKYLAPVPNTGVSGSLGYVSGRLFYVPGKSTKTLYEYDFTANRWTMMNDAPSNIYRPGSTGIVTVGSDLYVFFGNGRLLYKYTPNSNGGTWTAMAQSASTLVNGSYKYDPVTNAIYVLAGNTTSTFYKYSIASNTWSTLANLPATSAYGSAMTIKSGKIYTARGSLSKSMYVYDIATNTWSTAPDAPEQFSYGSVFVDVNPNYSIVFAGNTASDPWQFNYPSSTTSYAAQATHISSVFTISGLFDYAAITAEVDTPANTAVEFYTRTSEDGTNWSEWSLTDNTKRYTNTLSTRVTSAPKMYTQIKVMLISYDNVYTPTVGSYALNYYYDVDPPTNPTTLDVYTDSTATTKHDNNVWYNNATPYIDWPDPGQAGGATDGALGSNVAGYWVYVGTDITASPRTSGVFVESTDYTPNLTISGTYYVRIQAQDTTGNIDPQIFAPYVYKFDNTPPTNPALITVTPSGFTTRNNYTYEWPNAYDANSDVAGYCYHTGAQDGPFAADICQPGTLLENVSTAYQSGTNVFYVRAYDNAGNYAPSYTSVSYYYTTDPPGPVTNLRAVPPTSTSNLFAFTWDLPLVYSGDPDQMQYCYSINILPSPENSTCTNDRFISAFKAATQKGTNIIYMVAKDEAGNANWNSFASANFIANTVSPGIPLNLTANDTSDRNTSRWTITLTWDTPTFEGNGISDYVVQRSLDGHTFTTIGKTSTRAFVDLDVELDTDYYYRVASQDNVENQSGWSGIVIQKARGTFNEPPTIVVDPATTVGFDQAKITWATDRESTSFVYYGTSPTDLSQSKGSLDLVTDHSQTITGLAPSRTYYYRIQSFDIDRSYDLNNAFSDIGTFRTTAAAQIADVKVSDITADSAVLTWTTTVPTHARIQYGDNANYGLSIDDDAGSFTMSHTTKLVDLTPGTLYHFKIGSTTAFGSNLTSDDYTFTTIARPIVSNIRFQPIDNEPTAGVIVTWTTNVPTSSTVRYQAYGDRLEATTSELVTEHSIDLHELASNTDYQFTIEGRDQYGNLATSSVQHWMSQVDTRPPELSELSYNVTTVDASDGKQAQLIVTWKTDEPATSQLAYGGMNDTSLTKTTPLDTEPTTNHVVVLSGLELADIYKVQVLSRDLDGNTAKGSPTTVVTPDKQLNVFDTILDLMIKLFRF